MKRLLTTLVAVCLASAAALAQCVTTTSSVNVSPNATSCPMLPPPCAAISAQTITGDEVIMVLGSQERYALEQLHLRDMNWRDAASNHDSLISPTNPLTNFQPNPAVWHHGNPYQPYYQISYATSQRNLSASVAGTTESYVAFPTGTSVDDQSTLRAITERYRTLTPQQAMQLGYQPLNCCVVGLGQVYLNRTLVDNVFDPMTPEAFTFDNCGNLLSAQYILATNQSYCAFGQAFRPGDIFPGTQQLSAWLYQTNPNGTFAARTNTDLCTLACAPRDTCVGPDCGRRGCAARF